MAYDEDLTNKIRTTIKNHKNVEEKKMFGGITFMVNGKMCVGVLKNELMTRIDPEVYETALQKKGLSRNEFYRQTDERFCVCQFQGNK